MTEVKRHQQRDIPAGSRAGVVVSSGNAGGTSNGSATSATVGPIWSATVWSAAMSNEYTDAAVKRRTWLCAFCRYRVRILPLGLCGFCRYWVRRRMALPRGEGGCPV